MFLLLLHFFPTRITPSELRREVQEPAPRNMTQRLRLVAFAMLAAPGAAMRLAPLAPRPTARARGTSMAENRFSETILDESVPDPIYDVEVDYLGKSANGFTQTAETWNGRAAMAGFTICFLQEIVLGKGAAACFLQRSGVGPRATAAGKEPRRWQWCPLVS